MEQIDLSAAQIKSRDQEIERLKGELREATESLEATMAEEQVPLTFPLLHLFSQHTFFDLFLVLALESTPWIV